MVVKRIVILLSILALSTGAYAQKGLTKAAEAALTRRVVNGAKLPKLRDGVRNAVSRRLGNVATHPSFAPGVQVGQEAYPTRSVLKFGAEALKEPQNAMTEFPQIVGGRHEQRKDGFWSVARPGSGNVQPIALPAYALIKQAAIADGATLKDRNVLLQMAETLDNGFDLSKAGNWHFMRGFDFQQVRTLIAHFKSQWTTFSPAYEGSAAPLSRGVNAALDVLEIQAWMLANQGRLPTSLVYGPEFSVGQKLNALMEKVASDPAFAQDPAVQGAVHHLVHLRAVAKGGMRPLEVIYSVLERLDNGGRIPGSSLVNVSEEEELLTRELNYVEQLRRANLLYLLLPMEQTQSVVGLYMRDFQEKGAIYRKMIQVIPEFANDGKTLNVPTRDALGWKHALQEWQKARGAQGLSQEPRAFVAGRFGLPVNFNDLSNEEKTEVLLGTWLRIQK